MRARERVTDFVNTVLGGILDCARNGHHRHPRFAHSPCLLVGGRELQQHLSRAHPDPRWGSLGNPTHCLHQNVHVVSAAESPHDCKLQNYTVFGERCNPIHCPTFDLHDFAVLISSRGGCPKSGKRFPSLCPYLEVRNMTMIGTTRTKRARRGNWALPPAHVGICRETRQGKERMASYHVDDENTRVDQRLRCYNGVSLKCGQILRHLEQCVECRAAGSHAATRRGTARVSRHRWPSLKRDYAALRKKVSPD